MSLPVVLRQQELLASDHIGEVLLGIDWLEEQQAIWDMLRGNCTCTVRCSLLKPSKTGVGFAG